MKSKTNECADCARFVDTACTHKDAQGTGSTAMAFWAQAATGFCPKWKKRKEAATAG